MKKQLKKDLEKIEFCPDNFFNLLTETEKDEFLSQCSTIFNNKCFKRVCDELGTIEVLYTAKEAETEKDLAYGRGKIRGIASIFEAFEAFNSLHQEKVSKKESFDANSSI